MRQRALSIINKLHEKKQRILPRTTDSAATHTRDEESYDNNNGDNNGDNKKW
jgi:hypothetical protein